MILSFLHSRYKIHSNKELDFNKPEKQLLKNPKPRKRSTSESF